MICLFPNIPALPKVKRRIVMLLTWPWVLFEYLLNCGARCTLDAYRTVTAFPRDFYQCWNAERYLNGQ